MNFITQILSHKNTRLFIWVLIFILPILFIWQGGDLTDTGFHVTLYHFFFERLNTGTTDSLIFLTELIGGSWFQLFPNLGVLGIKVLAIIFFYINILLSWKILNSVFKKNNNLLPFFILSGVIFTIRCFPTIFNYDLLTSFFLLLSLYLLKDKDNCLTFGKLIALGAISTLMTLARFPNIFILILLPIGFIIAKALKIIQISNKKLLQLIIIYWLSSVVTALIFFSSISFLEWDKIYFSNLIDFSHITNEKSNSYNIGFVLKRYALDFFFFSIYFIATSVLFFFTKFLHKRSKKKTILFLLLLGGLLIFSLYPFVFNYNNAIKYIVPSLMLLCFTQFKKINHKVNWIGILLFLFMLIQIAGSNTGIFLKISLLFILALPLGFQHLYNLHGLNKKLSITFSTYTIIMSSFIYFVFIYGIGLSPLIRLKAIYHIEVKNYKGIYTTLEHAKKIKNITNELIKIKEPQQKMFIYGHQPMLYHLSNLAPAHKEFWLVGNNIANFDNIFDDISNQKTKPILLDTKEKNFKPKDNLLRDRFLKENNYNLVISNKDYNIWIPKNN